MVASPAMRMSVPCALPARVSSRLARIVGGGNRFELPRTIADPADWSRPASDSRGRGRSRPDGAHAAFVTRTSGTAYRWSSSRCHAIADAPGASGFRPADAEGRLPEATVTGR
jgi:hypothetical protein